MVKGSPSLFFLWVVLVLEKVLVQGVELLSIVIVIQRIPVESLYLLICVQFLILWQVVHPCSLLPEVISLFVVLGSLVSLEVLDFVSR